MRHQTARSVLAAFFRLEGPDLDAVVAAARRLERDRERLPAEYRLRMHPANVETWGDAAFHTLWHLQNVDNGPGLEGNNHPRSAFRRYAGPDEYAVVAADPDAGTIDLAFADDRTLIDVPSDQATIAAEALARGEIPSGAVEREQAAGRG